MPVLREDQEQRTGRRGRRWLWLLAVPPLFALLLVVPVVRPVVLNVGDRWLIAKASWLPPQYSTWPMQAGTESEARYLNWPLFGDFHVADGFTWTWIQIGRFSYGLGWFRGHRADPSVIRLSGLNLAPE